MNAALVRITPELLADWLCLPKGNRITGVQWDMTHPAGMLVFRLEGPDMPEVERGECLPEINPVYRQKVHELQSLTGT